MAKRTKKSNKGKVRDVSKPGETPASANARPTITGHSPVIKSDPMVAFSSKNASDASKENKEGNNKNDTDDYKDSYVSKARRKISPISDDLKDKLSQETEQAKEEDNKDKSDDSKDEGNQKENPDASGSDSAAIDAIAQTADSKKVDNKKAEEEQKQKEHIDGLIKSNQYRLPIVEGGHKGSAERIVSWLFLFLLLASVGVYLAIDAGYIEIGFELPFEFIKN